MIDPMRHHKYIDMSVFGSETFGKAAEKFARFFGTAQFILGQTFIIALWIIFNCVVLFGLHWDPYPFILLNLVFSTQAAYAAPLILLAQTRQADRDSEKTHADAMHRQQEFNLLGKLLEENTELTKEVHRLTKEHDARHSG